MSDLVPDKISLFYSYLNLYMYLQINPWWFFEPLGCQIILNKDLEGLELTLPKATRNFYVDGHVPEAH